MDKQIEKRIRDRLREMWEGTVEPDRMETVLDSFMRLVGMAGDDPDAFQDIEMNWAVYRNSCAEEGIELTPDEVDLVFNIYRTAMSVWEHLKNE